MVDERCQPLQSPPPRDRSQGGNRGMGRTRLSGKIHLGADAHGMPVRVAVTVGTTADYTQTVPFLGFTHALTLTEIHDFSRIMK